MQQVECFNWLSVYHVYNNAQQSDNTFTKKLVT